MSANQSDAPSYSALQLAWLQELGVEKPWLPPARPADVPIDLPADSAAKAPTRQVAQSRADVERSVAPSTPAIRPPRPSRPAAIPSARAASEPTVSADTGALAAAAVNLEALEATIKACQACDLCRERTQAISGQGVMAPAIMVVGEAPAEPEDRQGQPFVGRPGVLLDNMLTSIQSSRTQNAYVTHAVKCRPPGNRKPRPNELAACKPFVLREIELVKPFAILAVGNTAAQVLLESDGTVSTLRQRTHTLTVADMKIPLIVSEHPARLLGLPAEKAPAWQDLQLVRTVAGL